MKHNTKTALLAIRTAALEGRYSVIAEFAEKALGGKLAANDYAEGRAVALLAENERLRALLADIDDETRLSVDPKGSLLAIHERIAAALAGGRGEK